MHLAAIIFEEEGPPSVSEWGYLSNAAYASVKFIDMMIKIISAADCKIAQSTAWDYANYAQDLPKLLDDMINCTHKASYFTLSMYHTGSCKNISIKQLKTLSSVCYVRASTYPSSEQDK